MQFVLLPAWDRFVQQVEMHFVSSLTWDGFGKHMLRLFLCPRSHGRELINSCLEAFCVLSGSERVWSTYFEIHFESSLARELFGQHMLRFILCLVGMG